MWSWKVIFNNWAIITRCHSKKIALRWTQNYPKLGWRFYHESFLGLNPFVRRDLRPAWASRTFLCGPFVLEWTWLRAACSSWPIPIDEWPGKSRPSTRWKKRKRKPNLQKLTISSIRWPKTEMLSAAMKDHWEALNQNRAKDARNWKLRSLPISYPMT